MNRSSIGVGQAPTSVIERPTRRNARNLLSNWLVDDTTASAAALNYSSVRKDGKRILLGIVLAPVSEVDL